jgi:hypothetical protein
VLQKRSRNGRVTVCECNNFLTRAQLIVGYDKFHEESSATQDGSSRPEIYANSSPEEMKKFHREKFDVEKFKQNLSIEALRAAQKSEQVMHASLMLQKLQPGNTKG